MTRQVFESLAVWMGKSKAVREDGSPLVVYHASANEWEGDAFRRRKPASGKMSLGFHFGSAKAAEHRVQPAVDELSQWSWKDYRPHTMAVFIRVENPLRLRDIGAWHDPKWVLRALRDAGVQVKSQTIAGILRELKAAGYDGIVYENEFEDAGSQSWIVFDAKQIKSAIGNSGLFDRNSDSLVDRVEFAEEEDVYVPAERMRE